MLNRGRSGLKFTRSAGPVFFCFLIIFLGFCFACYTDDVVYDDEDFVGSSARRDHALRHFSTISLVTQSNGRRSLSLHDHCSSTGRG